MGYHKIIKKNKTVRNKKQEEMIMLKKEMARKGWRAMGIKMGIAAAAVVISLTA